MRFLICLLLLVFHVTHAEYPKSRFLLEKEGFCIEYDGKTKQPVWVCENLDSKCFSGDVDRRDFCFKEDKELPKSVRSLLNDYQKSGLDRGYMAAAANHTNNERSMRDTFLLSNVSPQDPKLNRGRWAKLEKHVRDLVEKHGTATILTGPLFVPFETEDGRKFVCYELIGESGVAVPSHYFKVIKTQDYDEGYILPNREIFPEESLCDFQSTVEQIEKIAGIVF